MEQVDASKEILNCFLSGKFKRMDCPQCENTFLTNVYEMHCFDDNRKISITCERCHKSFIADTTSPGWHNYVVLEKYALGLEYFCDAIRQYELTAVPFIRRIGILAEDDTNLDTSVIQLFTHEEPGFRLIYIMERLEHLDDADSEFFTEHVYGMDWKDEKTRHEIFGWIEGRYSKALSEDIRKLCRYHREHEEYLAWDLHGDNLMRRIHDGSIVVMDPFALKMGD